MKLLKNLSFLMALFVSTNVLSAVNVKNNDDDKDIHTFLSDLGIKLDETKTDGTNYSDDEDIDDDELDIDLDEDEDLDLDEDEDFDLDEDEDEDLDDDDLDLDEEDFDEDEEEERD